MSGFRTGWVGCGLLLLTAWAGPAAAKPPELTSLFPAGAQRGQTITISASGTFDRWPVQVWASGQGLEVKAADEKRHLTVTIASDAEPGLRWVRLYDSDGASALRPFLIGMVPEVLETEPNDEPRQAQTVEPPSATINGRLGKAGDVDGFAMTLKKGQTLVAALEAHEQLGSPMDAVLQLVSSEGFVLAQQDDDRGLDPLVVFEAPADGTYVVRTFAFPATPNSSITFAGGDAFIYRLTLTTAGFVDFAYPLAVPRCSPGPVELVGWNLPADARHLPVCPAGENETAVLSHPLLANTARVRVVPHAAAVEIEPNGSEHAQELAVPTSITGRISPARDRDVYVFQASKDQPVNVRVESRTLGSPLDPVVQVLDSTGKVLTEADDSNKTRDPELAFRPPADGAYRVIVRDLYGHGGDRFVYLLTAAAPEPDFRLTLATEQLTIAPGKPLEVPVSIQRLDGFEGVITIEAEGLPAGVTGPSVRSEPKGDTGKAVKLVLTGGPEPYSGSIRIVGQCAGKQHVAAANLAGFGASISQVWLTVLPSAPQAKAAGPEIP